MSTRHSKRRWKPANECGECRQPLEEWEVGICEGCGLESLDEIYLHGISRHRP
jgi:predicted amidophosphoribosyltransferase